MTNENQGGERREQLIRALHDGLGGNGWAYTNYGGDEMHSMRHALEGGVDAVLSALSPSEQPEPVAWRFKFAAAPSWSYRDQMPDKEWLPQCRDVQPLYTQPSEQTGARDAIKAARKYLLQIQEGREVRQEDGSTRMEDWDGDKVSTLAGMALAALSTAGEAG